MLLQLLLYKVMAKFRPKFLEKSEALSISLFCNWPIRFFLEFYLEMCISSIIKYQAQTYDFSTRTNAFDSSIGYIYLVATISAPFLFFVLFWCK